MHSLLGKIRVNQEVEREESMGLGLECVCHKIGKARHGKWASNWLTSLISEALSCHLIPGLWYWGLSDGVSYCGSLLGPSLQTLQESANPQISQCQNYRKRRRGRANLCIATLLKWKGTSWSLGIYGKLRLTWPLFISVEVALSHVWGVEVENTTRAVFGTLSSFHDISLKTPQGLSASLDANNTALVAQNYVLCQKMRELYVYQG